MKGLKRLLGFLVPYRWIMGVGFITVILPVMMELTVPRLLQYIVDQGIRPGDFSAILQGALIMFGAALVGALATLGQGVCRAQISQGLAFDVRNTLFQHIQSLSFANLDQMQTGRLMTRVSSDVDTVRMFASAGMALLIRALLMLIGSLLMLLLTDWQLALLMVGTLILAMIILRFLVQTAQPLFALVQQKLGTLNTLVQENLAGVQVVRAYVRERYAIDRFEEGNRDYMQQNIRVGRLMAVALPTLTAVTNVGLVVITWMGGLSVVGGRLSVGELIAFTNYLLIGMSPLLLLSNILMMVARADASAERIFEVLDTEPVLKLPATPQGADKMLGQVVFENVSFRYERYHEPQKSLVAQPEQIHKPALSNSNGLSRQKMVNGALADQKGPDFQINEHQPEEVLNQVSFSVEPGQRVALLGPTGSGKSSLVHLIPRFYDVTAGRIKIDGVDVRDWSPQRLRSQVGLVLQQTLLFSGTVRENIAYGNPDASLEAVMAAAKAAQAQEFIMAMPKGYDSQVEAQGANLSGGQKQRIAIARAILISPRILVLDDSTSAVDFSTEIKIQAALDELMRHCTTFIVAQRINSVLNADHILILDQGRIVAQGTHHDLLHSSPIYQDIYHSQLGEA